MYRTGSNGPHKHQLPQQLWKSREEERVSKSSIWQVYLFGINCCLWQVIKEIHFTISPIIGFSFKEGNFDDWFHQILELMWRQICYVILFQMEFFYHFINYHYLLTFGVSVNVTTFHFIRCLNKEGELFNWWTNSVDWSVYHEENVFGLFHNIKWEHREQLNASCFD